MVLEGLEVGERVVMEGTDRLRDGAEVEVVGSRRMAEEAAEPGARWRRAASARRNEHLRLFILRPVATTLSMVAILLAGLIACCCQWLRCRRWITRPSA